MKRIALSIKQPWVTLILAGIKTVEVRKWSRNFTGELYLHTGRLVDKREKGWRLLPPSWLEVAELRGGLVGKVQMIGCRTYRTSEAFSADHKLHWNEPDWYEPPVMYGLEFNSAQVVSFEPVKGNLFLFACDTPELDEAK